MVEIYNNYEIKKESTFRIGGIVKKVAFPETVEELIELLKSDEYDIVLGNCSNVLFSSDYIDKSIIITKNINNFSFQGTKLHIECGVKGPIISKECQKRCLSGFEFLIGFPGSFGGMICMNASAHNQYISDTFVSARVFDLNKKEIKTINKNEMEFSYRKSKISNSKYIVLDAEFALKEGTNEQIEEIMKRNIDFRKQHQPSLSYGNAGSIFKNPENDSAGRLLELAGAKTLSVGGAKVWSGHANFVVNTGNAVSKDISHIMNKMYNMVKEKYTIELEPEVKFIGIRDKEEEELWNTMLKK